jgi:hypothetical protein
VCVVLHLCHSRLRRVVIAQIANRILNTKARSHLYKFRRAIEEAEREIPGLMNVFGMSSSPLLLYTDLSTVSDIVDNVERVAEEPENDIDH